MSTTNGLVPSLFAAGLVLSASLGCVSQSGPVAPPTAHASSPTPPVFTLAAEVADKPEDPADKGVASRISKVTVYSDRALIVREAPVAIGLEPTVFRFKKLPGWVDEGSVRAATSAGKIVDVTVDRRFLARSTDEGFRKAELKHKALLQKLQAVDDELAILNQQAEHVDSIKVFSVEKLSKDAVTHDIKVDTYGQVIDFVTGTLRKTAAARRDAVLAREQLAPEVDASARNLEELRRLTKLEETTVLVTVQSTKSEPATLTLTYATPGATWEPMHEVRTTAADPDNVELTSFAVVTQTTGEDWTNADLSFSTQSASDSENIPELEMLALGKTQDTSRTVTRQITSFSSAQQKFYEQNRSWNRMNQAPSHAVSEIDQFEQTYASNYASFERTQSHTVEIFQGLSARGTTAHFTAKDPAIIRSDGRSIRLRIGASKLKATRKIIAVPEESLNAAVALEMTNKTGQPLLPGSAGRYRDGAFLGMTDVDFVADGEDFSVFFSVADQIKLTRELDKKQSSLVRDTKNRMQLSFVTTVKNLSDRDATLVLAERVPVSENTDIRVTNVKISPTEKPDSKGIYRWTLTLKPHEEQKIRISYQVDYPSSLILDVRRKQAAPSPYSPSPGAPITSPPRPAPKKIDLEERLYQMEKEL
ncbi:MAG: mucoidy inhibitor MuiA family protein [Polyangiaceae bacterium]